MQRTTLAPLTLVLVLTAAGAAPVVKVNPDDEKLLKAAKIEADGAALVDYFAKRTLKDADRDKVRKLIEQLGDDAFKVRDKALADVLALGPAALPYLYRAVGDHPDEEIKERCREAILALRGKAKPAVSLAAARVLRAKGGKGAVEALLAYLPDADNESVEGEVMLTLAVLGVSEGKVEAVLAAAIKEKETRRRAAAALVLGRSGNAEQRAAVQGLLADADPAVRFRAAQGLLAGRQKAAVPALIDLLQNGPLPLAAQALELLGCIAGPAAPNVFPGETAQTRKLCRETWLRWWRTAKTDLTRADVDLEPFNPTLRARAVSRRFVLALLQGDRTTAENLADFPFVALGARTLKDAADFGRFLDEGGGRFNNGLGCNVDASASRVVPLADFARNATADDKKFLARLKPAEVRVVHVNWQLQGSSGGSPYAILVRVTGEQARAIGLGWGNN